LLEGLGRQVGRRLSTAVVMFHQAVAEQFGMNATDFKCGDILSRTGPITAGELARILEFVGGMVQAVEEETAKLRAQRTRPPEKDRAAAPPES
jgi:hypothetical protein